jgi:hypothetical protein
MDYNSKDMLRSCIIPVLLGDTISTHILSAKIYLRTGITSYICDSKISLLDYIDPLSKFFSLVSKNDCDIICEALEYLASNKEYLPIIIPCNERYKAFVDDYKSFLEPRFILSDKESFWNTPPMSIF